MPLSSNKRPRGAPLGNSNSFKHGFYSKRVTKRDLSADDATILKSLADEIALIRVFNQRLIDKLDPSADVSELTDILRILCISSTTIIRILRVHFLVTETESILDSDIEAAIQQVNARLAAKQPPPPLPAAPENPVAVHLPDPHNPGEMN
jgi:hypothetical protein